MAIIKSLMTLGGTITTLGLPVSSVTAVENTKDRKNGYVVNFKHYLLGGTLSSLLPTATLFETPCTATAVLKDQDEVELSGPAAATLAASTAVVLEMESSKITDTIAFVNSLTEDELAEFEQKMNNYTAEEENGVNTESAEMGDILGYENQQEEVVSEETGEIIGEQVQRIMDDKAPEDTKDKENQGENGTIQYVRK